MIVGNIRVVGKSETESCYVVVEKRDGDSTALGMLRDVNR
jgi:hypothetical protein